jgi:hypothetical protein
MPSRIPSDVFEAFYFVVHDYDGGEVAGGGVPALARVMGMPPGTLYNKANINANENNHNKPTLKDAMLATVLTKDPRIVQAFARVAGGVFYQLPDLSHISTDALLVHLTKIGAEAGDFYTCLDESLRRDSEITPEEFIALEKEAHQWVSAILEALVRLREMSGAQQ